MYEGIQSKLFGFISGIKITVAYEKKRFFVIDGR